MPTDNKILNGSGLTTLVSLIKKDIDAQAAAINTALTNYVTINSVTPASGVTGTAIGTVGGVTLYAPVAEEGIQEETDPIFSASVASTITASDISNWNAKSDITPVQSDWAQTTTTSLDYIKNKPILPEYNILSYEGENSSAASGANFYHILATDVVSGATHIYQIPAYTPTPTHNNQVTTKSYVDAQIDAVTNTIPTKVSDLTNDSNFIPYGGVTVTSSISTGLTAVIGTIDGKDLTVDSQIAKITSITSSGATIYATATTLGGLAPIKLAAYSTSITEDEQVTTKKYVDDSIATALGDITGIEFDTSYTTYAEMAAETGAPGVIYLIPNGGDTPNVYDEYIYTNNNYEKIGTTAVDLSGYKPKQTAITGTPTASGTSTTFITNITQDANGVITRTAATLPTASSTTAGLMSASDKDKLDAIASGAEANVQADWSMTTTTNDAYIKNKPTITYNSSNLSLEFTGF